MLVRTIQFIGILGAVLLFDENPTFAIGGTVISATTTGSNHQHRQVPNQWHCNSSNNKCSYSIDGVSYEPSFCNYSANQNGVNTLFCRFKGYRNEYVYAGNKAPIAGWACSLDLGGGKKAEGKTTSNGTCEADGKQANNARTTKSKTEGAPCDLTKSGAADGIINKSGICSVSPTPNAVALAATENKDAETKCTKDKGSWKPGANGTKGTCTPTALAQSTTSSTPTATSVNPVPSIASVESCKLDQNKIYNPATKQCCGAGEFIEDGKCVISALSKKEYYDESHTRGQEEALKEAKNRQAELKGIKEEIVKDSNGVETKQITIFKGEIEEATERVNTKTNELAQHRKENKDKSFIRGIIGSKETRADKRAIKEENAKLTELNAELAENDPNKVKERTKEKASTVEVDKMTEKGNATKGNCGKYDGADCGKTENANTVITVVQTYSDIAGTMAVNAIGGSNQTKLMEKGSEATQADANNATADTAEKTALKSEGMAAINLAAAAYQFILRGKHNQSIDKVLTKEGQVQQAVEGFTAVNKVDDKTGKVLASNVETNKSFGEAYARVYKNDNEKEAINSAIATCKTDANLETDPTKKHNNYVACESITAASPGKYATEINKGKELDVAKADRAARAEVSQIVSDNSTEEIKRQTAMKEATEKAAFNSATLAAGNIKAALDARNLAKAAQTLNNAPTFSYSNTAGDNTMPPDATALPPAEADKIVDSDPAAGDSKLDTTLQPFNPNMTDGVLPSAQGSFNAAPPTLAAGGGGGGLSGGSGGTSAAKDDSKPGEKESNKNQAGGVYGAGDGPSGSGYARNGGSGGGSGVGIDTSFADMMKKLLPGGDDDKKKDGNGNLSYGDDRSPASNKAAVMGANKNIFDEIHKRYQQKNTEGAIVF